MKKLAGLIVGVLVLCVGLSLPFPALAQNYLVLKGGIYSPQNEKLYDFDSGFNGELAFGRYLNKNLAFEVASGYFKTRATKSADVVSAEATLDFNLVPLTGALRAIIPMGAFELYGLGGGGAYFLWTDSSVSTNNRSASSSDKYNQTLAGGFLGAGATIKVSPTVFLGLEGKYLWTTNLTLDNLETDINLNGIQATLNLGFLF
jgi:outer membrane protein W